MKSNQVVLLACALAAGGFAFPGAQEVSNLRKRYTGMNAEVSARSADNNNMPIVDHTIGNAAAHQREKPGYDGGHVTEKGDCNGKAPKKWTLPYRESKLDIEYDPDNHYIALTSGHAPLDTYISVSFYAGDNDTNHSHSERMYVPGANLAARHESRSDSDNGCKGKLLDTIPFDFSHVSSTLGAQLCIDQKKYNGTPFMCVAWNK